MKRSLMDLVPLTALVFSITMTTGCPDKQQTETSCNDGIDNDGDGLIDCDDPSCSTASNCQEPLCGDGVVDATEDCDGTHLGAGTCGSEGFAGGTLSCNPTTCAYDTTGCTDETCGNGVIDATEDCDGSQLGGETCEDLGHPGGGNLSCTGCAFDETQCSDVVTCDSITDVTPIFQGARFSSVNGDVWNYHRMLDLGGTTPSMLVVEAYDMGTPPTIGAHLLGVGDDANFRTCSYCTIIFTCVNPMCSDLGAPVFFASAGTMNLETLGALPDGHFAGSLEGVSWVEVTLGPDSTSTPVDGGGCFDLDTAFTFDATMVDVDHR